ncbi:hypothetical protein N8Z26_02305 [Burkholderiales bacterium]|nr:hypothetical protein [Burkholderiales bacterium]
MMHYLKKAIVIPLFALLAACLIGLPLANDFEVAPSFDCEENISVSQKIICQSPALSALDFELSTYIDGLRQLLTRTQYLVEARTFVEKRVLCGKSVECLTQLYETRLWRVRYRVNDLHPIEGSWVNDGHTHITIVKVGPKYRLNATSPGSLEVYCVNASDEIISKSAQFDKWDMKKNGVSYSWGNACTWDFKVSEKQLNIKVSSDCVNENKYFSGDFRKGEASDLAYVCFDR